MNLKTKDYSSNVWSSCGQMFMKMRESNPTP
jgi:hypothetical protein